ncbi:MAG: hypothetical protein NZ853_01120 [Leptospiraceae bacterium]|nr:hypothetical protein [Leptospiraceae bacterium]MDW7976170.1 hypothetical protein [Leptospiraceae bacterium]
MKFLVKVVFLLILAFPLLAEEVFPPLSSSYHLRIVNRKYVSYILFENIENVYVLTIILTHGPNYHAFKSDSYRLYYKCGDTATCLAKAKELDEILSSGYNIGFVISGDWIEKIIPIKY